MGESYPATDWGTYDVPSIAAMLTDTNQDSWDQVSAWRTTAETLDAHQAAMAKAITQLAQTWPPDGSPAAAEYIGYAQALSASVAQTADAAYANSTALANALTALENAQARVGGLYRSWQQLPTETSDNTEGQSLTTQLRKAVLNTAARQVMYETDQIILESARRLQVPEVLGRFNPIETLHPTSNGSDSPSNGGEGTDRFHPRGLGGSSNSLAQAVGADSSESIMVDDSSTSGVAVGEGDQGSLPNSLMGGDERTDDRVGVMSPKPSMPTDVSGRGSRPISDLPSTGMRPSTAMVEGAAGSSIPRTKGEQVRAGARAGSPADQAVRMQPESTFGIAPPIGGVSPQTRGATSRLKRRHFGQERPASAADVVPDLIVPLLGTEDVFDPGPGIIGIHR